MKRIMAALATAWKELSAESPVHCAVSGGLDSMVLLEAVARYRREKDPSRPVKVLHVNHGLRGKESDEDEAFVRRAAERLGFPFHSIRLHWQDERPSQALCRERRLAYFHEQAGPRGRIFLAHHEDDQAETIFLRLLRGSGLKGLKGMRPVAGNKLRPFLGVSREEICIAAEGWGVEWREDSSNRKTYYERNWIRREIFPLLEGRRPGFASRLAALAEEVSLLDLPAREPEAFSLSDEWRFYRAPELSGLSPAELSSAFSLSRMHTQGLVALLQKGSGRYEAKGQGFRLSAGVLLQEKRPLLPAVVCKRGGVFFTAASPLGRWEIELESHERAGFAPDFSLGEKLKKEFQRKKVPLFFRPWVPLLVREGKTELLLPNTHKEKGLVALEPLGAWWLHSIVSER